MLASILVKIGGVARHQRRLVLSLFTVLLVIAAVGVSRIEINDNPVNWFKANHEIRVADKALNQHFAGTYDAWLVLEYQSLENTEAVTAFSQAYEQARNNGLNAPSLNEAVSRYFNSASQPYAELFTPSLLATLGDLSFSVDESHQDVVNQLTLITEQALDDKKIFIEPAMLAWIADLQSALLATDLVGKSNSLSDIVKTVNRELQSGTEQDYVLPNSRQGVAQTLLQYQSSHRPQDLWHFVTPDYQKALLWLQMTSGDNQHTSDVVAWVNQYISTHPAPINVAANWAGKTYLNIVWQDAMVNGMMESLLSSFVIVFAMMVMLFRSIKYGVLAMLPLTFTITMIYGLIGWAGKAYDMPIAVLSALTLGLSIDFAIHFLQRVRELLAQKHTISEALVIMFDGPSRAISRNAIVIAIGFTPLLFSPLVPYITVGFFLASIMMLSALVTLLILPALLMMFEKHDV